MHSIDTLNMRSKVINGPKLYVFDLIRQEGFIPLTRGIQPVLYGYIFSSFIYFNIFSMSKSYIKGNYFSEEKQVNEKSNYEKAKHMIYVTFIVSFAASAIGELVALGLYYPYDLIKTRMQTHHSHYGYKGTLDAFIKIYEERNHSQVSEQGWRRFLMPKYRGLRNLYNGMFLYSLSYTAFVALEFSLFEGILMAIENYREEN